MERIHRRGCEFSQSVKEFVRARSQGLCEHPTGCDNPHDNTVDHFTGCLLGQLLGMERWVIKSPENAQMLCREHNQLKTQEENRFITRLVRQLASGGVSYRRVERLQLAGVYSSLNGKGSNK